MQLINGIFNLYSDALSISELKEGHGIRIVYNRSGLFVSLCLNRVDEMPENDRSDGNTGDYYIDRENGFLYFCIQYDPENIKWINIKLDDF